MGDINGSWGDLSRMACKPSDGGFNFDGIIAVVVFLECVVIGAIFLLK